MIVMLAGFILASIAVPSASATNHVKPKYIMTQTSDFLQPVADQFEVKNLLFDASSNTLSFSYTWHDWEPGNGDYITSFDLYVAGDQCSVTENIDASLPHSADKSYDLDSLCADYVYNPETSLFGAGITMSYGRFGNGSYGGGSPTEIHWIGFEGYTNSTGFFSSNHEVTYPDPEPDPEPDPDPFPTPDPTVEPSPDPSSEPSPSPSDGSTSEPSPSPSDGSTTDPEPSPSPSDGSSEPSPSPSDGSTSEPSPDPSDGSTTPPPTDGADCGWTTLAQCFIDLFVPTQTIEMRSVELIEQSAGVVPFGFGIMLQNIIASLNDPYVAESYIGNFKFGSHSINLFNDDVNEFLSHTKVPISWGISIAVPLMFLLGVLKRSGRIF